VRLLISLLILLLPGSAALAEGPPPAREPFRLDDALGLPMRLTLTVDQRTRYEYLDNQFRAGSPGSDQILALRTRVGVRLRVTDWLLLGGEFQDSRAYLEDANTPINTGLVNAAELLRAYAELTFDGPLGGSHDVQVGRLTMDVGSRRLVARNRFRNTSNAFTGFDWSWRGLKGRELRVFYTLPVQRLPQDTPSLRNNKVRFDSDDSDYKFAGLLVKDVLPWGDPAELYIFGLNEDAAYDATIGETIPRRELGTPGFRLHRDPKDGHLDYELETAFQFGSSRSTLTGPLNLDHFAYLTHLTLGYTFSSAWNPRVALHYDYASGDKRPLDGDNGRFDTLFGARRFEYGPTSIYGPWTRSNINTPGIRVEVVPSLHTTAFIDYRAVWLAQKRDEWVGTGVRDVTGSSGSFVGQQIEMRVRWWILPGNLLLEAGYAHLFAGEFIDNAPNSNGGDSNYVYTQFSLQF
jgi:hypothetical protein